MGRGPHCQVCGVEGDCSKGTMVCIMWRENLIGMSGYGIYICPTHFKELKKEIKRQDKLLQFATSEKSSVTAK